MWGPREGPATGPAWAHFPADIVDRVLESSEQARS